MESESEKIQVQIDYTEAINFNDAFINKVLAKVKKQWDEICDSTLPKTDINYLNENVGQIASFETNSHISTISFLIDSGGNFSESYPTELDSCGIWWSSIKLKKSKNKFFTITNRSLKKLKLKIEIFGSGFSIQNNGSNIILDSSENRTFFINFCPMTIGLSVGTLIISLIQNINDINKKKSITLYGYGGHSELILRGIHVAPDGCKFLTIGKLTSLADPLVKFFSITNSGSLDGFAVVVLNSDKFKCINIQPKTVIIPAGENANFKIIFKPTRNYINILLSKLSQSMVIADLKFILGDEPNRHRIRNIINNSNTIESSLLDSALFKLCCDKIKEENSFNELKTSKAPTEIALNLASSFYINKISLILNYSLDDSINNLVFAENDETIMYRNILVEGSSLVYEFNHKYIEAWSVKPNYIVLHPMINLNKKIVKIKSYLNAQHFKITSNFLHLFVIVPSEGQLLTDDSIDVEISMPRYGFLPEQEIFVIISINNEKAFIPIYIKPQQKSTLNFRKLLD